MRVGKALGILIGALLAVTPVLADPPLDGVYHSTAGDMLEGRGSESWPNGSDFEIGDALNWASWDGATLGLEWTLSCPAICEEPQLIYDGVNSSGYGVQIWQSQYCGGTFWLAADGDEPWGGGDDSYTASVQSLNQVTTILFAAWQPVSWITNMDMIAHFLGYQETCITLVVSNTERVGDTESQTFPPDYPDLVAGANCTAVDMGSAWDVEDITMTITGCATPVEETSWGTVKSAYR